jgi:anti-anti-sigma factor
MLNPTNCEARVTVICHRTATITITGELDKASAPLILGQLDEVLPVEPCEVIVDLTDVTFMDTGGLDLLDALDGRGHVVEPVAGSAMVSLVLGYWRSTIPA